MSIPVESIAARHVRRWIAPLLAAVVLAGGLGAGSQIWGWHSLLAPNPTPNLTATAIVVKPIVDRAVALSYNLERKALDCVCDPGLAAADAGPRLGSISTKVSVLKAQTRHQFFVTHRWSLDWTRVISDTTAQAQVSAGETSYLYQGLALIKRTAQTSRALYDLRLEGQSWKVDRVRTTFLTRLSTTVDQSPALSAREQLILDDTTGQTLYTYHADTERLVASTAKMLTAIVAYQHLRLGSIVTVPADAVALPPTTAGLVQGERMRVRDLFYGMLLPSGNDAAETLADATAGSVPAFAVMMNAEARRLHLFHSHFLVPHGLDVSGQYSTARDLAWLAHAFLRIPFLAQIVRTRSHTASSTDGAYTHHWQNLNQLLGRYPGAIGVKTGTTPAAGANLVASAVRGPHRIIAVLLGDTPANRYPDASRLLDFGWRLLGYAGR
jgi:D-alanyl-D-alanine carboxypeptidase